MQENLLKKMISVVDSTMEHYQSDFYKVDLSTLVQLKEYMQFVWLCARTHTALAIVDFDYWIKRLREDEALRFTAMRDKNNLIASIMYWGSSSDKNDKRRMFHFNGDDLVEDITLDYINNIWTDVFCKLKAVIEVSFPEECKFYGKPLPIRFASTEVRRDFIKVLRESTNPQSLIDVVKNMRRYARVAIDEYVEIGYDFAEKSFSFGVIKHGECTMNGGIIYYKERVDAPEHWQIHT